jgi:hypothetical protein
MGYIKKSSSVVQRQIQTIEEIQQRIANSGTIQKAPTTKEKILSNVQKGFQFMDDSGNATMTMQNDLYPGPVDQIIGAGIGMFGKGGKKIVSKILSKADDVAEGTPKTAQDLLKEKGISSTLIDEEITAANYANLQMSLKKSMTNI